MPIKPTDPTVSNMYTLLWAIVNKFGPAVGVLVGIVFALSWVVWVCTLQPSMAKEQKLFDMIDRSMVQSAAASEANREASQTNAQSLLMVAEAMRVVASNATETRVVLNQFNEAMIEFREDVREDHQHANDRLELIEGIKADTTKILHATPDPGS